LMQSKNLGYPAVSLGSTRPCLVLRIINLKWNPVEEQAEMGWRMV
jgi:hypothetical protein